MSSKPGQPPSLQRVINRAYVQVPPSPLTKYYRVAGSVQHLVLSNSEQKENAQPKISVHPMSHSDASQTSLKRKFVDREPASFDSDGAQKKSKFSSAPLGPPLNVRHITMNEPVKNISEEFPDGFVYCHQCNKKRDLKDTIACNSSSEYTMNASSSRQKNCKYKYCRQCLKNRYNEDINTYRVPNAISGFKCPRCRDICNCPRCRKAKGLEPVGVIGKPLGGNVPTNVPGPNAKPKRKEREKQKSIQFDVPRAQKSPKRRELPLLKWRRVPINLTLDEAEDRVFIREFLFRFGDILDPPVAKSHLEDLEALGGRLRKTDAEDDVAVAWASEPSLRALLIGLLGLLAQDRGDEVGKIIKTTIKELRTGGVNLSKYWLCLHTLRAKIAAVSPELITNIGAAGESILTFPDPLPPPASSTARSLRSVRIPTDMINVFHTSQMIPVVMALIHAALETNLIREYLDQGLKDHKDYGRAAKEAMKTENERWEKERKTIEVGIKDKAQKAEKRAKRCAHNIQMTDIENALKIIGSSFAPRFTNLGTDNDGRVYYALSPGAAEREAAFEYVEVASSDKAMKLKKKGRVLSLDDRREMRDWSWFIAVWGTRPPFLSNMAEKTGPDKMAVEEADDSEDSDEEDEENVPRWWGFWDVEEIAKLAEWISVTSDLEEESDDSTSMLSIGHRRQPRIEQLKRLVGHLREYALLLQWRASEDKYTLVN